MKNIVVFIFLFFLSVNLCWGSNLLQQEFEAKMQQEIATDSRLYNMDKEQLLQDDYMGYLNGGRSHYGYLLKAKDDIKKTHKSQDLRYINLMLNQYNMRVNSINPQLSQLQKISVDDNEYEQLSDLTKLCLFFHNVMAY